jgi:hypothetical protein
MNLILIIVSFHLINFGKDKFFNFKNLFNLNISSPRTQQHVVISSTVPSNGVKISPRSPLNLVEDEESSTTSIIMFQEDNKR